MSKIIFLNGCGSSGKTSIAHGIQYVRTCIYGFFSVAKEACKKIHKERERRVSWKRFLRCERGKGAPGGLGRALSAAKGRTFQSRTLHRTQKLLFFSPLLLKFMKQVLRNDRRIGLSNDQIDRMHEDALGPYDVIIDTTSISPFDAARLILTMSYETQTPQAFQNLMSKA